MQVLFLFFPEILFICFVLFLVCWSVFFSKQEYRGKSLVVVSPVIYLSGCLVFLVFLSLVNFYLFDLNFFLDIFVFSFSSTIGLKILILLLFCFILFFLSVLAKFEAVAFEYILLLDLVIVASFLMLSATDFLTFYIALEIQSLALYVLVSSIRTSVLSVEAGIKYFILGALVTGFFLFGLSYIYLYFGSLDFLFLFYFLESLPSSLFLNFSFILILSLFFLNYLLFLFMHGRRTFIRVLQL